MVSKQARNDRSFLYSPAECVDCVLTQVVFLCTVRYVGLLGILLLLCFRMDDSSQAWKTEVGAFLRSTSISPVPRWRKFKLLQFLAYAAIFLVYYTTMEVQGFLEGMFSVLWVTVGTLLLPCALGKISYLLFMEETAQNANADEPVGFILTRCRALPPLVVGIQGGVMVSVFGLLPCLDGAAVVALVLWKHVGRLVGDKYGVSRDFFLGVFGLRLTAIAKEAYYEQGQWLPVLQWAYSATLIAVVLLLTNAFWIAVGAMGLKLGEAAYEKAKRGAGLGMGTGQPTWLTRYDNIGAGITVFVVWLTTLSMIIAP